VTGERLPVGFRPLKGPRHPGVRTIWKVPDSFIPHASGRCGYVRERYGSKPGQVRYG